MKDKEQNPAGLAQLIIVGQQDDRAEPAKESSTLPVFVNSEPMREEQGLSLVVYKRSFLEKKPLTKEEIDEAFQSVPVILVILAANAAVGVITETNVEKALEVLYRFLDYLSKFDWENYCISLNGPVCKSSLPDIVAEAPENERDDLLLSEEFIRNCVEMFSVPARGNETNLRAFSLMHLNLIPTKAGQQPWAKCQQKENCCGAKLAYNIFIVVDERQTNSLSYAGNETKIANSAPKLHLQQIRFKEMKVQTLKAFLVLIKLR
ncbi:uncharacterized protein LOC108866860 [Pyrus x bretschneideri]|uniref:uncharacterized protein LOC108866860 n=1 Tax=Pyrus x bretschneideri TaxID=225117 RepID=UPI00202FF682|nr:uncharacterized protein LOC108866860 [Pyrus x bretschneideri]